jgi:peptidoglycan/xylan/chitin deacetylase (PgdA/CDA1 family)
MRRRPRSRRTTTGTRRRRLILVLAALIIVAVALGFGTYRLIPSRTTQLAGELVQRVETDERVVALTFDDGPTDADADAVLEALAQRGVVATFYVNGQDIEKNSDAMQAIIAGGHEIGNHTWSHRSMAFVTFETVADEIESTDAAIRSAGYEGPITFRPPFGNKLLTLPLYLAQHDRLTVTWDVSAEDFSGAQQSSSDIVDGTVGTTSPGSIILLHPWFGRTSSQQAIGELIDQLQAQGYQFVTVSDLIDRQR